MVLALVDLIALCSLARADETPRTFTFDEEAKGWRGVSSDLGENQALEWCKDGGRGGSGCLSIRSAPPNDYGFRTWQVSCPSSRSSASWRRAQPIFLLPSPMDYREQISLTCHLAAIPKGELESGRV
jgi:hypothetical protein